MKGFKCASTASPSRAGVLYAALALMLASLAARAQSEAPPLQTEARPSQADEPLASTPAPAATPDPAPARLPLHQHGVASLKIIVQGQRLAVDFKSPAMNLTGFERAPQSDTEQRTASYAKGQLQQAPRLFITSPGANCRSYSVKVDEPDWQSGAEHQDYRARYIFQCQRPQLLEAIDVQLASQLAAGTKLQTEVLAGPLRQSLELSASRTMVRVFGGR